MSNTYNGTPVKCPKCDGMGQLLYDPQNPYASWVGSVTGPWSCPPCGGTGIMWASTQAPTKEQSDE